jgi:hypothetical protein
VSGVKTFAVLLTLPVCALAADAKPAPKQPSVEAETIASIEFLEYLGSLESDDDNWTDFETAAAPSKESAKQPASKPAETATPKPAAVETRK